MKDFCIALFTLVDKWTSEGAGRERIVRFGTKDITVQLRTPTKQLGQKFSYQMITMAHSPTLFVRNISSRLGELK